MKVYISFGQIHVHSVNRKTFDKDSIAVIECKDYEEGRKKAFEYFDDKFHNCWNEEEFTDELLSYFPRGLIPVNF